VVASLKVIDPQVLEPVGQLTWTGRSKYKNAFLTILKAEHHFNVGDAKESLAHALVAIGQVAEHSTLGDAAVYLASWARHIEGRSYEALKHWESAATCYEASLSLKMQLGDWLPPAVLLATEVKLGGVEILQSPIQAVFRLEHVVDVLDTKRGTFQETPALYENLVEDSRLRLAQAYLGIGNERLAIRNAKRALFSAKKLNDSPGEIQAMFVLYRASALERETLLNRLEFLLKRNPEWANHPAVTLVRETLVVRHSGNDG
jgi:tetratricopeptide (TPR) repeat protein